MIFLSAGHHQKDPGAVGNGFKEADLTIELRDMTAAHIRRLGGSVIVDKDYETLGQYISRIKPGDGSVVCEPHFNAAASPAANGTECIHAAMANKLSIQLSERIALATSAICGLTNRGAKSEIESHRGRLAILHTAAGISCLPEICFISNRNDLDKYQMNKEALALELALILIEFDRKK